VSVEDARREYLDTASDADACTASCKQWVCTLCGHLMLLVDAASITLDLAAAEASIRRTRGMVAW